MFSKEAYRPPEIINFQQVAITFPGQGAQTTGMGLELYRESAAARAVFQEADSALGFNLSGLMFGGSADELRRTINAQPAILTHSIAVFRVLEKEAGTRSISLVPFLAGHSLGEYTSLVAAGALNFSDAVKLVRERGRLMEEAGKDNDGSMTAIIGLNEQVVESVCRTEGVEIANINCDGQIVISGNKLSLARAIALSRVKGAKRAITLEVSGAFHSILMLPAVIGLKRAIEKCQFKDSRTGAAVISNVTAKPLRKAKEFPNELVQQLCKTVRWQESVEYMKSQGAKVFLELGPGEVLTGLAKRIGGDQINAISLGSMNAIRSFAS